MSLPVPVLLAGCGGGYAAYGPSTSMTCVPYARAVTGLPISGNAASWWDAARGRFIETDVPAPGAVLVFRRTGQLPSGHLAVISSVLSARRALVTQANWLPYRITSNQPVLDVSPANNWTAVRVWWPPINGWGSTVYPTYGFILSGPGNAVSPGASPPLVQAATPAWRTGS
ncbi:MAG: CHAP domain-containing protein [Proteobacteria bacterium]|nr:CHAP domain-containing protein [Pseudomonadota bacterium]